MQERTIEVLLVEDEAADIYIMKQAFEGRKSGINLRVVEDGVKAMAYLHREDPYADAVRPDLILLDLNLPKKDGREVLAEIKRDETLKSIPVLILSTSDAETDISKTYQLGANAYITKPMGLDEFTHIVNSLKDFWFKSVKLPPR